MEKANRIQLVYGYAVCVIAVVTFLICASVLVNNVFDLANPIAAGGAFGTSLSSFEAYQATTQRTVSASPAAAAQADTASEATLRRRFDALRADRISRVTFQAWKAIVTSGLLLIISVVLFGLHWRWMRKLGAAAEAAGA